MSEWIKRSEQEPLGDGQILKANAANGAIWSGYADATCSTFTHWMSLPDPPPRMVTIEISEEDARWAADYAHLHLPDTDRPHRIIAACRKALEGKR